MVITVVRRPSSWRAARSRAATSSSVWASTALVGSTSTRTSGSATSTRARAIRCRCPPENPRPRLVDLLVEPVGQGVEHVLGGGDVEGGHQVGVAAGMRGVGPRVELVAQHAGEQPGVGLGDQHPAADGGDRQVHQPGAAEGHSRVVGEPAEPVGDGGGLVGVGAHQGGERAGLATVSPDRASDRVDPVGGSAAGSAVSRISGSVVSTATIRRAPTSERVTLSAASTAVRMGMHEEERVAVERDDVADVDGALEGQAGAEPGDEDEEDAWQQDLRRVEGGLRRGDPDAGAAQLGGPVAVARRGTLARRRCRAARAARRPCRRRGRSACRPPPAARAGDAARGRSSGPSSSTMAGTPRSTTRPSVTELRSRITATTT